MVGRLAAERRAGRSRRVRVGVERVVDAVRGRRGPGKADVGVRRDGTVHRRCRRPERRVPPGCAAGRRDAARRAAAPGGAGCVGGAVRRCPAVVLAVHVEAGSRRERRAIPCVTLEAMKMEHVVAAPSAGTVADLFVGTGDQVTRRRDRRRSAPTSSLCAARTLRHVVRRARCATPVMTSAARTARPAPTRAELLARWTAARRRRDAAPLGSPEEHRAAVDRGRRDRGRDQRARRRSVGRSRTVRPAQR